MKVTPKLPAWTVAAPAVAWLLLAANAFSPGAWLSPLLAAGLL